MANPNGNPLLGTVYKGRPAAPKKPKPVTVTLKDLQLTDDELDDPTKIAKAFIAPRTLEYLTTLHNRAVLDGDKDCARYLLDRVLPKLGNDLTESDSFLNALKQLAQSAAASPGGASDLAAPSAAVGDGGLPAES